MDIFIRPIEPRDANHLLALLRQLLTESTTFTLNQDISKLAVDDEEANILNLQTTTNNIILVAVDEKENLYGLVSASALLQNARHAEIGLAVLQAYQGFGLAQALMDELLTWADDYSTVTQLMLTVQAQNVTAIHIYEKFAFKKVAQSNQVITLSTGDNVEVFDMVRLV